MSAVNGSIASRTATTPMSHSTVTQTPSKIGDDTKALESLYCEFTNVSNQISTVQDKIATLNSNALAEKSAIVNIFEKLESNFEDNKQACLKNYDKMFKQQMSVLNSELHNLNEYKNSLSKLKV